MENLYETAKEILLEAMNAKSVIVKLERDRYDPNKQVPTFQGTEKQIISALRKMASPLAQKALAGAYMDGVSVVNKKTSATMANAKVDMTVEELLKDIEKWAQSNIKVKTSEIFDIKSDTRAIITVDSETAKSLKTGIHDAKAGIKVRIMDRKDGAKVYIDTKDKKALDTAIEQAKLIMKV